tara:strand:+ start:6735 stop:6974 length:240 start_codon:yes stop_codon:yes gene_type:complete
MIDYYLEPGDLIITKNNYGILLKKEKGQWHYMSHPHGHSTPEWYSNIITAKNLYYHLDEGSHECRVIYAPGKRRKRKKC